MPFEREEMKAAPPLLTPEIKHSLQKMGRLLPIESGVYDGPARRFRFEGALGEIGFISPVTDHFCHKCNRLRLTADGKLRLCLLSNLQIDLKGPLRASRSDSEISELILDAIKKKPFESGLSPNTQIRIPDSMSAIGG
jgi:cyclic pyranopterin phosphate synthase